MVSSRAVSPRRTLSYLSEPWATSSSTNSPSASATAPIASWSALCPNRSTGITALGLRPSLLAVAMPRLSEAASMLKVVASTSTKTGVAPASATASPVAQKVKEGQSTASPEPTSFAISTIRSASVPLEQDTTCLAPLKAASSASSWVTSGPFTNWQWSSTRETASSRDRPNRLRWAATSMKGMGCERSCRFMGSLRDGHSLRLADHAARSLAGRRRGGPLGRGLQAAGGDFEAGDAFIAGDCRRRTATYGLQECDQFRTKRFVVPYREVAHRIAAFGLEAKAFGDLAG